MTPEKKEELLKKIEINVRKTSPNANEYRSIIVTCIDVDPRLTLMDIIRYRMKDIKMETANIDVEFDKVRITYTTVFSSTLASHFETLDDLKKLDTFINRVEVGDVDCETIIPGLGPIATDILNGVYDTKPSNDGKLEVPGRAESSFHPYE